MWKEVCWRLYEEGGASGGMKVEEKKRAFEEWLQCNSVEKLER